MNRQRKHRVCGGACALMCLIQPALVSGQQQSDPFIENLRQRNEVTSQALEQSRLGGLFGVIRGDHLKGSGQRGAGPLFRSGQPTNQNQQLRQQPHRSQQAARSRTSPSTQLSLRNPLEGRIGWLKSAGTVRPAYQQPMPQGRAHQARTVPQKNIAPAPRTTQRTPRAVQQAPRTTVQQTPRAAQQTPGNGGLGRLFAGLRQKHANRVAAVRSARSAKPTKTTGTGDGGLFAFLRKDGTATGNLEGDWSREAQRRTDARSQMTKAQKPKVQLASLDNSNAGALGRMIKKPRFNSWMGVPKDEEQAPQAKPKPKAKPKSKKADSTPPMTTWEKRYVKSDRTGFHAAGKRLDAKRPDRYLSRGTTVQVTNRGWNWSNVVLSDGRIGSVQTSRLSRSPVDAKPPRSTRSRASQSVQSKPKSKPKTEKRNAAPKPASPKKKKPPVDRSDDPLVELESLTASKNSSNSSAKTEMSRAALDAVLEPSLESLLDPGVEATLRDLEDDLLLPLPPVFPDNVDTGAGMLPPLE